MARLLFFLFALAASGNEFFIAYDFFRGLPDGSWEGNIGALASVNFGKALGTSGIGGQAGVSYGIYDWTGRSSIVNQHPHSPQQQAFVTAGLFHVAPQQSGVNAALAFDWMVNRNLGVFAIDNNLAQVRAHIGYLFKRHELGIWGTVHTFTSHREAEQIPLTFKAIDQINLFWRYALENGAKTELWIGTPYTKGEMFSSGRAMQCLLGARLCAPLLGCLRLCGHALYTVPQSAPGDISSRNYGANLCLGLSYSFGNQAKKNHPFLPVADNSNFLIDTNLNN